MLEWTGERYLPFIDPAICGAEIHYEHLHRYAFAAQYVQGKTVLDLASGEGFGTSILAKNARSVTGIDIDHEAVLHASARYQKENITFVEGSILNIPLEGRKLFDVIVCFEAIEHVREHDLLFSEITRLLKDDGILIISTPNKKTYSDDEGYKNPFHEKELYFSEFLALLKRNFTSISISGQQVFSGSSIYPVSSEGISSCSEFLIEREGNQFSFLEKDENQPRYFVAIASNSRPDPGQVQRSYLIDRSNTEIVVLNNQIREGNAAIQSLNQGLVYRESQLSEAETKIQSLTQDITATVRQLQALTGEIAQKDRQLEQITATLQAQTGELARKNQQLEQMNRQLLDLSGEKIRIHQELDQIRPQLQALSEEIARKNQQLQEVSEKNARMGAYIPEIERGIAEKDTIINEITGYARHLEGEIAAKNRHIGELTNQFYALQRDHHAMMQSATYQVTRKFHLCVVERIFPPNTRRRTVYDRGLKLGRIVISNGWREGVRAIQKYHADRAHAENTPGSRMTGETGTPGGTKEPQQHGSGTESADTLEAFLSKTGNRLVFPTGEKPRVSIIILTYNKASFTFQCLESILKHTHIPYELVIVDNGSTDTTSELLARIDHAVLIKNQRNLGFIQGCNDGARSAQGRYVLFLNNDTVVTENWLSSLVRTMETYPRCGAVGCRLVWPDGRLQEAGSIIWRDGSALGYGRGDDPSNPAYSYLREVDYCSGACLLVRRDLFIRLNGFDARFSPAYYEDSDLCTGIKNLGYHVVFQPEVTVYHHEFTSSSAELAKQRMAANQVIFLKKWDQYLLTKKSPSPENVLDARDVRHGKKILFLDDRIPASHQGSGYPRSNIMLKFLGELNYKVTFFPMADTTPWQPYTAEFQQSGIEVFYGENLDFLSFARERAGFYDVIIVSRPHNFEKTCDIIRSYFPDACLMYDAEALFSTRDILKAKTQGLVLDEHQIQEIRAREINLMNKADLVITVSDHERTIIQESGGPANIVIFGHSLTRQEKTEEYDPRSDILFVGSFLAFEGPNDDAILYFIREVWPGVREELSCKLYVVGVNPPESLKKCASSSVIITGYVPDLKPYYDTCRIFIVPHRYAAGIPLKLLEAMSYGIPSVVSELIASQLGLRDGEEVLVARDAEEFGRKIIQLYKNRSLWQTLQRNSLDLIEKNYNPRSQKTVIRDLIEKNGDPGTEKGDTASGSVREIPGTQTNPPRLDEIPGPDGLLLPPKDLVFLVTGQYDQQAFYENSLVGITCIREIAEKNGIRLHDFHAILDFGCGCGRILRHWKTYPHANVTGLDYNPVFLDFCREAFPFARFGRNQFDQPLACEDNTFDFIYAISVFTHLTEDLQIFWIQELRRVLKPGGYIYLTTHGKSRIDAPHLSDADREHFMHGEMIVYNETLNGTNLCGTYHPESWVRNILAKDFRVIDFIPDGAKDAGQDAYLLQKPER